MERILSSYDPSNGEILGEVMTSSEKDIKCAVSVSKLAHSLWSRVPIAERVQQIHTAFSAVESKMMELTELLSREMGKDTRRSAGEVQGVVYGAPYIAEEVARALISKKLGRTEIEYKSLGTVAVISPWNYPLAMAINLIIPALTAGNSVIWKPSEETPLIAQELYKLVQDSLPENLLQIVHGDSRQGKFLVDSDVDMVAFTGSQAAGKDIMGRAAKGVKRLIMELGGNDPLIVLKDANLDAAARFAVASSFENAGQMCTSTERIYVDASVAEQFERLVVSYATQFKVGPWNMDGVNIGPIINKRQHQNVVAHISDALVKGARCLLGGQNQEPPYIQPTVLSDMAPDMLIEGEETFGPVVCISSYTDLSEAVDRANNSTYGLGAVVYGGVEAEAVAAKLVAGMIGINQGAGGGGDVPWVGAKQSGFGFHGSVDGHKQFTQVRVVNR